MIGDPYNGGLPRPPFDMLRSSPRRRHAAAALLVSLLLPAAALAAPQETESAAQEEARTLRIEPAEVTLEVGESIQLAASVRGPDGEEVEATLLFFSRARRSLTATREGLVTALKPGEFEVIVRERQNSAGENQAGRASLGARLSGTVKVTVRHPALERIELVAPQAGVYAGTTIAFDVHAIDVNGAERTEVTPSWSSSNTSVASFNSFGELTVHVPGTFAASVEIEGLTAVQTLMVQANPITGFVLEQDVEAPRTGDVVNLRIDAFDAAGEIVLGVPVEVSLVSRPDDTLGPAASGQIEAISGTDRAWRFVAEQAGQYTFIATSGAAAGRATARVTKRNVAGKFTLVGQGRVDDTHTSDFWVWEGVDGRDYAVTGTWGANGDAHFWDVTDPSDMKRIATVNIDARTVNDVKISADGRMCILSREGLPTVATGSCSST